LVWRQCAGLNPCSSGNNVRRQTPGEEIGLCLCPLGNLVAQ
jgi:hypothetical protein